MFHAKKGRLSWQEALKFINKCPVCGAHYEPDRAKIFAEKDQANLVHISCVECRGNFIAMIIVMTQGISTIGMVSDWTFEDASRLHLFEPISIDELIEGRQTINEKNLII